MEEEEVDEALPLTVAGVERSEVYEAEAGEQHNETLGGLDVGEDSSDDSDDDDDEESGVKVVLTANSYTSGGFNRRRFSRGANKIQASAGPATTAGAVATAGGPGAAESVEAAPLSEADLKLREELNALRCSYHKTAFDVDIDGLDERPWRGPGVDISDYFNYGFTEATWRIYAEKQLRLRAQLEAEGKLETKIIDQPAVAAPNKPNFSGKSLETEHDGHVESKATSPRAPHQSGGATSGGSSSSRLGVPAAAASPAPSPSHQRGQSSAPHQHQQVTRAPPIQPGVPPPHMMQQPPQHQHQHEHQQHPRPPFPPMPMGMNPRGPPPMGPPFMPPHGMPPPPHMMPPMPPGMPGMDMPMPPYGMHPGMMPPHPGGFGHGPPPPRDDRRRPSQQHQGDYPPDRHKYQRSR